PIIRFLGPQRCPGKLIARRLMVGGHLSVKNPRRSPHRKRSRPLFLNVAPGFSPALSWVFSISASSAVNPPIALRARRKTCPNPFPSLPSRTSPPPGDFLSPKSVRDAYLRVRPLAKLSSERRSWTLDMLNAIHSLKKKQFSVLDAYSLEPELSKLHPANQHVRPKIRQQLQVLRDLGLLEFLGDGHYRLS